MNQEIEALLRKARTKLRSSQILLKQASVEEDLLMRQGVAEDAVSRAYYAMFLAAKAVLIPRAKKLNVRKEVAAKFKELLVDTGRIPRRYFDYLNSGEKQRRVADYETDLISTMSVDEAAEVFQHACEFVTMAGDFLQGAGGESENP
jgi:uncharacterized protein